MTPSRTWLVIPAMAVVCAGIALAMHDRPEAAVAIGALGAGIAGAVRALTHHTAATTVAAGAAALLGAFGLLDGNVHVVRAAVAGAAAMFAIAELARLMPAKSPFPAVGAALVAAMLDPSFVALVAIAGIKLVTGPWARPRWALAVPALGIAAAALALLAASLPIAPLWLAWSGTPPHAASVGHVALLVGDMLGPIVIVAAVAGIVVTVSRGRFAAASVAGVVIGAIAVDLHGGVLAPATLVIAALAAGVGIGRLAAMVRWPAGQTLVCVTASFVVLVAPALGLALR